MLNYHASDYMSIKHQVAINATETVKSKLTFEREDKSQGVMIHVCHTDILNSSKFTEEPLKKQKNLRFSGAGSHIKTGRAAECDINTVANMASAILMQAWMICHKDTLSMDYAVWI